MAHTCITVKYGNARATRAFCCTDVDTSSARKYIKMLMMSMAIPSLPSHMRLRPWCRLGFTLTIVWSQRRNRGRHVSRSYPSTAEKHTCANIRTWCASYQWCIHYNTVKSISDGIKQFTPPMTACAAKRQCNANLGPGTVHTDMSSGALAASVASCPEGISPGICTHVHIGMCYINSNK